MERDSTKELVRFFVSTYPHPLELSKARLTKMVYLADWFHALSFDQQITPIKWTFNHYGPYVDDIINTAVNDPDLEIVAEPNLMGNPRQLVRLRNGPTAFSLTENELESASRVISETKSLYWNGFISYVYGTLPVASSERYSVLDLTGKAQEIKSRSQHTSQP